MKNFLVKSFYLSIPLIIWVLLVVCIDPFNYFEISKLIPENIKEANSKRINTLLYIAIDNYNHPSENMLIGDSRTESLPTDEIEKLSGVRFKKLVSKGTAINEIFDLIYFSNQQKKLKRLVVGINFNMFNKYEYYDRVTNVKEIIGNPLKYIFNRNVAEACFYNVRAIVTSKELNNKPEMPKEKYWNFIVNKNAATWFSKFQFPEDSYKQLFALDSFALKNKIDLTFIIVPVHQDFHDQIAAYGLLNEELNFKKIVSTLHAKVVDYDFDNDIIKYKENFNDPFHYNKKIGLLIVDEVWGNNFKVGQVLTKNTSDSLLIH